MATSGFGTYGTGEMARLFANVEHLAHPRPVRSRGGQLRRDPAAEWDWFYGLDTSCRRWIARHLMAPDGEHGEAPDQLAALVGFNYVEEWAAAVLAQVDIARKRGGRDPLADDWEDWASESAADDLIGPEELADLLEVRRPTLSQWRHRGILPAPDLTISGVPLWHLDTVTRWARDTGRELVEEVAA